MKPRLTLIRCADGMPYADEYKRRNGAASGLVLLILTFMAAVIGVIWGLS